MVPGGGHPRGHYRPKDIPDSAEVDGAAVQRGRYRDGPSVGRTCEVHGLRQHHEQDFQRQKRAEASLLSPVQAVRRQRGGKAVYPPLHPPGPADRLGVGAAAALYPELLHPGGDGASPAPGYQTGCAAAGAESPDRPAGKAERRTQEFVFG